MSELIFWDVKKTFHGAGYITSVTVEKANSDPVWIEENKTALDYANKMSYDVKLELKNVPGETDICIDASTVGFNLNGLDAVEDFLGKVFSYLPLVGMTTNPNNLRETICKEILSEIVKSNDKVGNMPVIRQPIFEIPLWKNTEKPKTNDKGWVTW